jgi:hypothetical protein
MVVPVEGRARIQGTDSHALTAGEMIVSMPYRTIRTLRGTVSTIFGRNCPAGHPIDSSNAPTAADADTGIELRNISVRHGRRLALDGIIGRFEPGSLTASIPAFFAAGRRLSTRWRPGTVGLSSGLQHPMHAKC